MPLDEKAIDSVSAAPFGDSAIHLLGKADDVTTTTGAQPKDVNALKYAPHLMDALIVPDEEWNG
ncbi:hypothetical protein F5880DRAFT_1618769 [Lentinula raphanica]|nr:hypothetical protein F5880DRAFT_1618769 [Lentinula raphanica]